MVLELDVPLVAVPVIEAVVSEMLVTDVAVDVLVNVAQLHGQLLAACATKQLAPAHHVGSHVTVEVSLVNVVAVDVTQKHLQVSMTLPAQVARGHHVGSHVVVTVADVRVSVLLVSVHEVSDVVEEAVEETVADNVLVLEAVVFVALVSVTVLLVLL